MERWPLLISVPHAGTRIPAEVVDRVVLTRAQIVADSDDGSDEIYLPLEKHVVALVTSPISRTLVDLNRAPDDRRPTGVVKRQTFSKRPVFRTYPGEGLIRSLVDRYHRPYHRRLRELAAGVRLGIDCHLMAPVGPKVGPDPGQKRPRACLGFGEGTCPLPWVQALVRLLSKALGDPVEVNRPFSGGYITRSKPGGIPWIQLELNAGDWMTTHQKRQAVHLALEHFSSTVLMKGA